MKCSRMCVVCSLESDVDRAEVSRQSTHFEIFRRRFDGVVIYFFDFDFKFFDDVSEFSVTFYMLFFSIESSCQFLAKVRYMSSVVCLSVCLSVVCNVRAQYSGE